jgi:hypothetical protein
MTKTAGVLFIALAVIVLAAAIGNFAGQSTAAATVADRLHTLELTTTDLRWPMGVQFLIDLVVVAPLAIIGWFLFGSETEQYAYVVITGLLLVGGAVIRFTPLVPLTAARLSPTVFFLGAQVQVTLTNDDTSAYLTLPENAQDFRVGRVEGQTEKQTEVLLDFHGDSSLAQQYWNGPWPVTVLGSVGGTRTLLNQAQGKDIFLVPRVKVFKVGVK